jgi:hypothetical protein
VIIVVVVSVQNMRAVIVSIKPLLLNDREGKMWIMVEVSESEMNGRSMVPPIAIDFFLYIWELGIGVRVVTLAHSAVRRWVVLTTRRNRSNMYESCVEHKDSLRTAGFRQRTFKSIGPSGDAASSTVGSRLLSGTTMKIWVQVRNLDRTKYD